jgi:hypothetical protein
VTWTKLSDDFSDDCWTLSDAAFRLHVDGLLWSNRKLLDLHLPKDDVPRFSKRPEAATELVAAEWWADRGDHYEIRHHAIYQRTRENVVKQQEVNAENGRKGGRPPKPAREIVDAASNPVANPVANPVVNRKGLDRAGSVLGSTCAEETQELDAPEIPEEVQPDETVSPFRRRYTA